MGENAALWPELIERELDEGHEVGNHTYTHANLSKLSYRRMCDEVIFAENVLYEENEHRTCLLRPPGGLYNKNLFKLTSRFDYTVILWSVDTRDWAHTPSDDIVKKVMSTVKTGDVILFHDYVSGKFHDRRCPRKNNPRASVKGLRIRDRIRAFRTRMKLGYIIYRIFTFNFLP